VSLAELQLRQALDSNKDGTVTEDEARFFLSGADSFDKETFRLSGYPLLKPYLTQEEDVPGGAEAGEEAKSEEGGEETPASPPLQTEDPAPSSSTPEVYDPWRANQQKEPEVCKYLLYVRVVNPD
jgi:hypothetical protein